MPLAPGTRLGGYEIVALIGSGGMGEVYKAIDTRLGRSVAIKIMPTEVAGDPELRSRFECEARTISKLSHPHICTLYDVGRHADVDFLVLEHLEGETLAARLGRGPLDRQQALTIAADIAGALEAAHGCGIIHRDLKPANAMLTRSGVKLLDFGLAKLRDAPIAAAASLAPTQSTPAPTAKGTVLGTLPYMAPEQLEGRESDARTDIWAFGCLLYELFTGARLFDAPRGRRFALRPRRIQRVVRKCLEPVPDRRWASMAEIRQALQPVRPAVRVRWAAAAVVVLATVAGTVALWRSRPAAPQRASQPMTVLVADFRNTTSEGVFDGVIDAALAVALESSSFLNVYNRRDALIAAAQIGRSGGLDDVVARLVATREGVPLFVTGSIATASGGYDLSAAVIESVSGAPIALVTESAVSKSGVLNAVASMAERLRAAIGDVVVPAASSDSREPFTTSSLDAAKAYTVAQGLAVTGRDEEAIALYQDAVRIDPEFGRAYAGWAVSADKLGRTDESSELFQKALSLLARMNRRERLRTEGVYTSRVLQDYPRAREIFGTLISEYPADMAGHNNLAVTEFMLLRFEEAFQQGQHVVTMWPQYSIARVNLSLYAMYAGHFEAAAEHAKRAIALNEKAPKGYIPLGVIAATSGNDPEAITWYDAMARAGSQGSWLAPLALADLDVARGRLREAEERLLARMVEDERAGNRTAVAYELALLAEIAAAEGRTADVVRFAERTRRASSDPQFTYRLALALIDVGRLADARVLVAELATSTSARASLYRRPLEAEIAAPGQTRASEIVRAAEEAGTWWAYYRASVVLSRSGDPLAETALQWCRDHRSQSVSAFYDDVPTVRYYVAVGVR